jgi:hypothetical protein
MECAEGANGKTVSHDWPHHSVSAVFLLAKSVAVLDPRVPAGKISAPRADVIFDSDIVPQNFVAPAVVVSGNPQNGEAKIAKLGESGERAKAAAGNYRLPFKPEVEQIAIDDERSRSGCQSPQKTDELAFRVAGRDAKVRVGDYVTRRSQHWRIVVTSGGLHKPARVALAIYLKAQWLP